MKDKAKAMKKFEDKYHDVNEVLIKKYIDVEKCKISYLNGISKSEEIISKYYENKRKLEDGKTLMEQSAEEIKNLMDKNKEYESQKKSIIKETKKYENEYIDVIKSSGKYEDKFLKQINECISGMKNISLELTDKIKDTIILFSSSIKDSFKVPLDVIDSNLKNLTSTNIKENMDKAIIKSSKI